MSKISIAIMGVGFIGVALKTAGAIITSNWSDLIDCGTMAALWLALLFTEMRANRANKITSNPYAKGQ